MPAENTAIDDLAALLVKALDSRLSIPPISAGAQSLTIADAYRVSRAVTARRVARGETPVGRKIGFTNRTIWAEYGVHYPIDGPVYDTTLTFIDGAVVEFPLSRFIEPRIEPEIVLGLLRSPEPDMDEEAAMSCIGWVAHGFEIVQSVFPDWRFSGADCIAAFGLHGALICGPRRMIEGGERAEMLRSLRTFEIDLNRNGVQMDAGRAANVLDGPVSALLHLVRAIAADSDAAPLRPGDVVTTGTLTRAFPVGPGERWTTRLSGIALPGMDASFSH